MRDSLVRWLGGVPKSVFDASEICLDSWRSQCIDIRAQNSLLVKTLEEATTERKELQTLIFKKFGLSSADCGVAGADTNAKPFSVNKRNVMQTMQAMEMDDKVRAKAFAPKEIS